MQGAREHNLKNVSVEIPRDRLTVITGLSGSGKSSLAFDTLYAEGQRKYVESLSAYARQFLEQMQKPDVDHIEGLSPAISIEQRTAGSNPRSTVGTTTEIHDYLRVLYAGIGKLHCPVCGKPISSQSAEEIVEQVLALGADTKLMILAPLIRGKKGQHEEVLETVKKQGYVRVRIDGVVYEMDALPELDKKKKHSIEVVVDRIVLKEGIRTRLTDSVESALKLGEGLVLVMHQIKSAEWKETVHSEKNACVTCGISFDTLLPRDFSFNSPYGACPECHGLGMMMVFDEALVVPDPTKSLDDGAIVPWRYGGRRLLIYYKALLRSVTKHFGVDLATPFNEMPKEAQQGLLYGTGDEPVAFYFWRGSGNRKISKPFEGVIPNLARRLEETESEDVRQRLRKYMAKCPCKACHGKRLKPEVLACTIHGKSIMDLSAMPVRTLSEFFRSIPFTDLEQRISREIIKEIGERLQFLIDVGLDYLTLERESGTLSGGEAQRIRLATQIGAGLVGVLYVLDEPSIGLHARDNERLIRTLTRLRDAGNTVVVVEHDEQMIREADYVIDLGPGAGRHGGQIMYAGDSKALLACKESLTAQYLTGEKRVEIPERRNRPERGWLEVIGASENNLKNLDVRIPLGLLVGITGVSGSGKSSLVDDILRKALFQHFHHSSEKPGAYKRINGLKLIDTVIVIDQSPIGRTPRSNPATYTNAFALIRDLYAQLPASKVRGYKPGRFSFNVKGGRCEKCRGDGVLCIEMHFLPDVYVPCEQCGGRRYNKETLEVKYNGKSIADVLEMTIDEALDFFEKHPPLERKLRTLSEVGLGYLHVGQPATTLSGGEAQRLKLSAELSKRSTGKTLYILDEPTTGLHFADVHKLMDVLLRLRDAGNTVLVIEHNQDVIKMADYLIDLGPEGGEDGGRIVAEGTPEEVARCEHSYTGQFLRHMLPGC